MIECFFLKQLQIPWSIFLRFQETWEGFLSIYLYINPYIKIYDSTTNFSLILSFNTLDPRSLALSAFICSGQPDLFSFPLPAANTYVLNPCFDLDFPFFSEWNCYNTPLLCLPWNYNTLLFLINNITPIDNALYDLETHVIGENVCCPPHYVDFTICQSHLLVDLWI